MLFSLCSPALSFGIRASDVKDATVTLAPGTDSGTGTDPELALTSFKYDLQISYVAFDISKIPSDAVISSANAYFYVVRYGKYFC